MATSTSYRTPVLDLGLAFEPGRLLELEGKPWSIAVRRLGDLVLPTGEIHVADAGGLDGESALRRRVPPGAYPVDLSLVSPADGGAEIRVACVRILFQLGLPIVEWELALSGDENLEDLGPFEMFGFSIDAGLVAVVDRAAIAALQSELEANGQSLDNEFYFERILPALETSEIVDRAASLRLGPEGGANLIVSSTGFGDGSYPGYWGLAPGGEPVCLVLEFGLLQQEQRASRRLGSVAELAGKKLQIALPAGELTLLLQLKDPRRMVIELAGDGETSLVIELEHQGKELHYESYGGSTSEMGSRIEQGFREPIPAETVVIISYPDHIGSRLL